MKTGFPNRMSILDLWNKFKSKQEFQAHISANQKEFCSKLLRACHFKRNEFQIGNTQIFLRKGNYEWLVGKLESNPIEISRRLDALDYLKTKWKIFIIFARFVTSLLVIRNNIRTNFGSSTEVAAISDVSEFKKGSDGKKRKFVPSGTETT